MRIWYTLLLFHVAAMIHAQQGFISLDCGSSPGTNYTENGINFVSDEGFIESGVPNDTIYPKDHTLRRKFRSHRSFPENERNCYTLRPHNGKNTRYLIRAEFLYGGDKGQAPQFDLYIGADYWTTHTNSQTSDSTYNEIIHVTLSEYINVCLVNTGYGPPYITALLLRPLDITMNDDDKYDRLWNPISLDGCKAVQSSDTVSLGPNNEEQVPSKVMSTAITPTNSTGAIVFSVNADNTIDEYIFYIHLAEVQKLETNQTREVNIYINGELNGPFPVSTSMTTIRRDNNNHI
ncbi:hypothetical protein M8C21_031629 [Ambrosia artemisiifolia]|uniref:Malectin-like domain-containing protein n=1 Tax=Ambrosia artemisiifolia TaxID=4212 RepID=A0AAD5G4X3_AMBAR|nr:hypothetical protein M8C21_031629 [Ambrosia artemisiifolia]